MRGAQLVEPFYYSSFRKKRLAFICPKKFFYENFEKGIDNTAYYAILKVQKENNLQKMLTGNINLRGKLYEIQVAAKAGHGIIKNLE